MSDKTLNPMETNSAHGFTEGSEFKTETKETQGEHKQCPILKEYLCSECKDDCKMEIKSKIYVDGGKEGDYIAQKLAFRREMEMNYAKLLDKNFQLRSELQKAKEFNGEFLLFANEMVTESNFPGCNYTIPSYWKIKLESLIKKI